MKANNSPTMVIVYQRGNNDSDLFHMHDWRSNHADVLWVALLLDCLPSSLVIKSSQLSKKQLAFNPDGTTNYFLTQVPEDSKFEFKDLVFNPFLPETGLNELKAGLRLNWKSLTLRFEFPIEQSHLEVLKLKGRW
ncbi:hypothetical protein ACPUEN_11655 [Algoriphagus yeomjeoni]|uniref:hypothetical protein n=1 Tax=Algoriphagus yeomjeoni TaxID=291403 RepID=UPI003CE4D4E3